MYIAFDIEATGLERGFAQILQLAMIFADDDFNLMAARNFRCRKLPWVVPSPEAMLITHLTPDDLKKQSLSHAEMMGQAVQWIQSRSRPITYLTYNGHSYDVDMLNAATYQTLHDSVMAQDRHFDVFRMVQAVSVLAPDALTMDIKNKSGTPSLGLGVLCRQNGIQLDEDAAHDALNDVKATLALAKLLRTRAPALWAHMDKMADADGAASFMRNNDAFLFSRHEYGRWCHYAAMAPLDTDVLPQARVIVDLGKDPSALLGKSADELYRILTTGGRARDDQPLQLVPHRKQPILTGAENMQAHAGVDPAIARARAAQINAHPDFAKNLQTACARLARKNAAAGLNGPMETGFDAHDFAKDSQDLRDWRSAFNSATEWDEKRKLVRKLSNAFNASAEKDPALRRLYHLAQRIAFSDAPDMLGEKHVRAFGAAIYTRIMNDDPKAPYMTIPKARKQIANIEASRAQGDPRWKDVTDSQLRVLKLYFTSLEKEFEQYRDNASAQQPKPAAKKP